MTDEEEDAIWQQVYATGPRAIGKAYIERRPEHRHLESHLSNEYKNA